MHMFGHGWRGSGSEGESQDVGGFANFEVIKRLLKYLLPYRSLVVVSVLGIVVYTMTIVMSPWIVGTAIDKIIKDGSLSELRFWAIVFFVNVAINYVSHYVHLVITARVTQNALFDLRCSLFSHMQILPMSFYDTEEKGRIMSRLQNDVHQLQEFLSHVAIILVDMLTLTAIVLAMFLIDWSLALIALSAMLPLLIFAFLWQRYSWPRFMRVRRALANVNGNLQENISGMRVIQSLNRQSSNLRHFDHLNADHLESSLTAGRLSALLLPIVEIFTGLAMGLVIVFGGSMIIEGELAAVGVLVAFTLYIQRFFEPIRSLTMQYAQVQRAMTSGSHIFELMDIQPEIADKPGATVLQSITGEISLEDVSFHYNVGQEVLKGITIKIMPGERLAIVGPTGAGKTTLASLITRLYDVTGGKITVDGYDIRDINRGSLVSKIGTVQQDPFLFSGNIMENIRFSHTGVSDEEVVRVATLIGAHDFIVDMPGEYGAEVTEGGENLSPGQRQLLSLARALVFDPKIVILDEATASVDSHTESMIQNTLEKILEGRTSIVIAHRLSTVRNADRIAVIDDGMIVELGNHADLLRMGGLYSSMIKLNSDLS